MAQGWLGWEIDDGCARLKFPPLNKLAFLRGWSDPWQQREARARNRVCNFFYRFGIYAFYQRSPGPSSIQKNLNWSLEIIILWKAFLKTNLPQKFLMTGALSLFFIIPFKSQIAILEHLHHTPPPWKFRNPQERRSRKIGESQMWWMTPRNHCLPDTAGQMCSWTHLTVAVTAQTIPTQSLALDKIWV